MNAFVPTANELLLLQDLLRTLRSAWGWGALAPGLPVRGNFVILSLCD